MFLTQIYGTILGGFVNYGVMISIVNSNRELLIDSNGNASWSGATIQSYNTNATSWALAKYLYKTGAEYEMVPIGLAIGAGAVALHRIFVYVSSYSSYYCPSCSCKILITNLDSSFPRFETSMSMISTCPSSSNMLAISHTTSLKPALSGASLLLVSSHSFTSETTALAFLGIIRTWSLVPLMVPVSQYFSSFPLQSLGLVALRSLSLHGGVTMLTATMISALYQSRAQKSWTLLTSSITDLLSMLQRLKTLIFLT